MFRIGLHRYLHHLLRAIICTRLRYTSQFLYRFLFFIFLLFFFDVHPVFPSSRAAALMKPFVRRIASWLDTNLWTMFNSTLRFSFFFCLDWSFKLAYNFIDRAITRHVMRWLLNACTGIVVTLRYYFRRVGLTRFISERGDNSKTKQKLRPRNTSLWQF